MASISKDPNGNKRILFVDGSGNRRTLYLGSINLAQAQRIKLRIEQVLTSRATGIMDPEAASWVGGLDDGMYEKLVRVGLVPPREHVNASVGGLWKTYLETRDVKPSTLVVLGQIRRSMETYFGKDRPLASVTPLDAEKWRQSLTDDYSTATISKRVYVARALYRKAVKWGMCRTNPFDDLHAGSQANRARAFFVSPETTRAVLDKCPDAQWRVIVGLSRYAGLRCPSEVLALRWGDVIWDRSRLLVRSPKTEKHEGKECREVPIIPELKALLVDAFHETEPGTEHVVHADRHSNANLRTQFHRIIKSAGHAPWPRLFHNMRASCATELVQRFPSHVVGAWLGHSVAIAEKHYLQVRESDFERAAGAADAGAIGSAFDDAPTTQTTTRQASATLGEVGQREQKGPENTDELLTCAHDGPESPTCRMAPLGFEPRTKEL